jgi:hypothetical protein
MIPEEIPPWRRRIAGFRALATDILHIFPFLKCGFDRQKVCMLGILRVSLDSSVCSRESATSGNAEGSLTKNFRQRFGELLIKCRNVSGGAHEASYLVRNRFIMTPQE